MTDDLVCNFQKCNKALTANAYITVCSHVFCQDHGYDIISKSEKRCPACKTSLMRNYDMVKTNLNPDEQFKSMVLAGLRPEIILEIANRGLAFWGYQKLQDHLHMENLIKSLRQSLEAMNINHIAEMNVLQTELESMKRKQRDLEAELQLQKARSDEMCEKLSGKDRDIQKYQMLCETLKKKQLTVAMNQQQSSSSIPQLGPHNANQANSGANRFYDPKGTRMAQPLELQPPTGVDDEFQNIKLFMEDAYGKK